MDGAIAGLVLLAVLVVFAIIIVAKSVALIPQAEAAVIERLGRYSKTVSGQLTLLLPFVDKIRARVDLRERVVSFPPQPVITEDNLTVNIDTVVYFQVTNPQAAVYQISNYIVGVEQLTTTTLRNVVGGMTLEQTLTSRDSINGQLRGVLDEATNRWGLRVARVELRSIDPPPSIQDSMEKQMRADREKRAMILTAEGNREASIKQAEGQKQAQILAEYMTGARPAPQFFDDFKNQYSEGFNPEKDLQRIGVVNQTTMLASDTQGIALISKAGYAPQGLGSFLATLADRNKSATEKRGLFSSHPEMQARQDKLTSTITKEKLAGTQLVEARYVQEGGFVESVRMTNVPSYLHAAELTAEVEGLGEIVADVAYGGNFYAIVEPQKNFPGLEHIDPSDVLRWSPKVRAAFRRKYDFVHPESPAINGLSHVMWTGTPTQPGAHAKNAVFYGDKAIDRSPCGTGTSARLAHLAAKDRLKPGDSFVHESYIGSRFTGKVEGTADLAGQPAIIPSITGSAIATGFNTIWIDREDAFWEGFQVV